MMNLWTVELMKIQVIGFLLITGISEVEESARRSRCWRLLRNLGVSRVMNVTTVRVSKSTSLVSWKFELL